MENVTTKAPTNMRPVTVKVARLHKSIVEFKHERYLDWQSRSIEHFEESETISELRKALTKPTSDKVGEISKSVKLKLKPNVKEK